MILIKPQIEKAIKTGDIEISPFDPKRLNPNSYNLRLADEIAWYKDKKRRVSIPTSAGIPHKKTIIDDTLDMKEENELERAKIPEDGFVLQPNRIYLARTIEYTKTKYHIPMLEGRSSVGRLGLFIHATAGFGDIGFEGYWTLELSCVQPIRIYAGIDICQIYYNTISSHIPLSLRVPSAMIDEISYKGKYQSNEGIQGSMIYKDFN